MFDSSLPDVKVVQRKRVGDQRGSFERLFCLEEMSGLLAGRRILQVNRTVTETAGTLRGLHFQFPPHAEMKMVVCLRGGVFDVAVDLRRGSSTFLSWHAEVLSPDNQRALLIPEGFAHGFQSLVDESELLYLHTAAYVPSAEGGVNPLDPRLGIPWPLPVAHLSARDADHPMLDTTFQGI
jgi:dTDP-4-dehydrorhamnose 3,5-epimerase